MMKMTGLGNKRPILLFWIILSASGERLRGLQRFCNIFLLNLS